METLPIVILILIVLGLFAPIIIDGIMLIVGIFFGMCLMLWSACDYVLCSFRKSHKGGSGWK